MTSEFTPKSRWLSVLDILKVFEVLVPYLSSPSVSLIVSFDVKC